MHSTHLSFGRLRCRILTDERVPPSLVVMLCHGFGAQGDDLVSLADVLRHEAGPQSARLAFVFPEAPMDLSASGMPGRAWWPIDINRLLSPAGAKAGLQKMRDEAPEGLAPARKLLRECIAAALQHWHLTYGQLVLGGFSQGAMITTDIALRIEEAPAALAILSGTLIDARQWQRLAPTRQGLHVVQSHGTQDPILPYAAAEDLRDMLLGAGLQVDFGAFKGGHTIEGGMLRRFGKRLAQVLEAQGTQV